MYRAERFMREIYHNPEKVAECAVINLALLSLAIGLIAFMGHSGLIKMSSSAISGLTFAAISGLSLSFILYNCACCKESMGKKSEPFEDVARSVQRRTRLRPKSHVESSHEQGEASLQEQSGEADEPQGHFYEPSLSASPRNVGVIRPPPVSIRAVNTGFSRSSSSIHPLRVGVVPGADASGFPRSPSSFRPVRSGEEVLVAVAFHDSRSSFRPVGAIGAGVQEVHSDSSAPSADVLYAVAPGDPGASGQRARSWSTQSDDVWGQEGAAPRDRPAELRGIMSWSDQDRNSPLTPPPDQGGSAPLTPPLDQDGSDALEKPSRSGSISPLPGLVHLV